MHNYTHAIQRIEKIVKRLFPENQQIKEKIEEAYDKLKDNGNKLGKVEEEIESSKNSLFILNCSINNKILLAEEEDYQRCILEIKKENYTPDKYPRRPGKAKKKPL